MQALPWAMETIHANRSTPTPVSSSSAENESPEGAQPVDLLERLKLAESLLAQTRERLAQTEAALHEARQELEAITESTSWRLTALVRTPILRILGLRHTWSRIAYDVASQGGWHATLSEAATQFRLYRAAYLHRLWLRFSGQALPETVPGSGAFGRNDYHAWQARTSKAKAAPAVPPPGKTPLISIVIPTYRPPLPLLQEAIDSVRAQSLPSWQLCIADDASADPELDSYLNQQAAADARIKVVFRERNGHISACTNTALTLADGDFVLLLDQDDLLTPDAVAAVVRCIEEHPDVGIIYSDEDRINEDGSVHTSAYFKPDFNYDLLLGQNMVSHLGVFRRQLITDIGGFREGLEGSQDYDLALRAMERLRPDQIRHIPKVLYHWRAIKGSTALDHSEKSYASTAGRRAIEEHLHRTRQVAEVLPAPELPFLNRVRYPLPAQGARVSMLIALDAPAARVADLIAVMWRSRGRVDLEFIVCMSGHATTEQLLAGLPPEAQVRIELIHAQPGLPLSERVNAALPLAQAPFAGICTVLFDRFSEAWLEELVRLAAQERVGFVAPRVHNAKGHMDHGGILFTDEGRAVYLHKTKPRNSHGYAGRGALQQSFRALSAALLLVRRPLLADLGPLTPDFPGGLCLVDKCLELDRRGLSNVWTPYVDLEFDDPSYSGRVNLLSELGWFGASRRQWNTKWGALLPDPAYNPNLSRSGDFSLNWKD